MTEKKCSKCKQFKSYDCFSSNKCKKDGLDHYCKICHNEHHRNLYHRDKSKDPDFLKKQSIRNMKNYYKNIDKIREQRRIKYNHDKDEINEKRRLWILKNPIRRSVINTINAHLRKGCIIQVSIEEVEELCRNTPNCKICGIEFKWGEKKSIHSPSLDRINNEKILTNDNIQILCWRCNTVKGNMTMKEFIEYCNMVSEKFLLKSKINSLYHI